MTWKDNLYKVKSIWHDEEDEMHVQEREKQRKRELDQRYFYWRGIYREHPELHPEAGTSGGEHHEAATKKALEEVNEFFPSLSKRKAGEKK